MRDPGILAPRHFFFARHFLWKDGKCLERGRSKGHYFARHLLWKDEKCLERCGSKGHYFARHLLWKDEKCLERCGSKGYFFARTFLKKMKRGWKSVQVKGTFLPGTYCDNMKRAWKGAEVNWQLTDTILSITKGNESLPMTAGPAEYVVAWQPGTFFFAKHFVLSSCKYFWLEHWFFTSL